MHHSGLLGPSVVIYLSAKKQNKKNFDHNLHCQHCCSDGGSKCSFFKLVKATLKEGWSFGRALLSQNC